MMTQMAPLLEMMKTKMGKRRFGQMMQTMAPMMSRMMENGGGLGGMAGGFGGGSGFAPQGYGMGIGGGDFIGMLGGAGGSDMMSMIPQLMQIANFSGGRYGHRRRRHRKRASQPIRTMQGEHPRQHRPAVRPWVPIGSERRWRRTARRAPPSTPPPM